MKMNEINETLSQMVDKGIISMSVNEDGEIVFFMSEEQKKASEARENQ